MPQVSRMRMGRVEEVAVVVAAGLSEVVSREAEPVVVDGLDREAVIAAALTGMMILLFLGSWRSTLIITISIPLAILASITARRYSARRSM